MVATSGGKEFTPRRWHPRGSHATRLDAHALLPAAIHTSLTLVTSDPALEAHILSVSADVRAALGDRLDRPVDRPAAVRTAPDLAGRIDHTNLKASATADDITALCAQAAEYHFATVCVNGRWVPLAAELLADSTSRVCTVVGFPLGAMASRAKAYEAEVALADGADEVDMVLDIGAMLSGDLVAVFDDIAAVVDASRPAPVKVIFENCLLTDDQKIAACIMSAAAGAAYVKTSTGMGTGGATVEDVALMRAVVGDELGVKAAGAVRSRDDAEAMMAAGADRLGTSGGVAIVTSTDGSATSEGAY